MDRSGDTTTLRGGHLRAPLTHAVDIDEHDPLHRVAHQLAAGLEGPRRKALEHTLEPVMGRTDIGDSQRAAEPLHPPTKRAPPAHRLFTDTPKRAHLAPHLGGTRALPPPSKRPRDGRQPVSKTSSHPTRHHRHHSSAAATKVAAHRDLDDLRRTAGLRRPELKTPSKPVPDNAEALANRAPSTAAARTPLWTDCVRRRKASLPKLDIDRRNNDA